MKMKYFRKARGNKCVLNTIESKHDIRSKIYILSMCTKFEMY